MGHYKTNIENTKRKFIDYFRMQEEEPSQDEMVDLWNKIKLGVDRKKRMRRQRHFLMVTATAAALIGFIWLGFNLHYQNDKLDISVVATKMLDESVDGDEIRLVVSGNEEFHVKKGATVAYTQEGDISIDEEKVSKNVAEDLYDQLIVPKGKFTRLILADGSSLYVNAGTKVIYPKHFEKNKREIFVDGEVYIDVKRDETAPFYVKTAQFDVQVLGTAFDVKAYSNISENAEVVLVRGKVNIKSKSGKEMILTPDNKATILSDGVIERIPVNAEEYVLWTKGILSLNDEELKVILGRLSRYYGVDINCNEDISRIKIAGKIDLECGIEEALERISVTGRFKVLKQENSYILKSQEKIAQ